MRVSLYTLIFILCFRTFAWGFEYVNQQKSYENNRLFSLHAGLGIEQFMNSKGVDGSNPGIVFQAGVGHRFNSWLGADIVYQFSTFRFNSPDPIVPTSDINTRTGLHQEFLRLKAYYPAVVAQPYISAGIGGYQFFGLNGSTALSIPPNFMIPLGVGLQTFIYKNNISLDFDFTYHWFLGENQGVAILRTLGLNEVSFNMYSLIGGFSFHFL